MTIYLINLIVVTLGSFFGEALDSRKKDSKMNKYNLLFYFIPLLSLILVSGFRYKVGTDFRTYSEVYTFFSGKSIKVGAMEIGFGALMGILHKISSNPQFLFLMTSIIINLGIVIFLKNYSEHVTLSMYFYITTYIYYGTMNGIRQYIASVILLLGFKWMIKGNFKKYLIYIGIASLFHTTALLMIPVYFLARRDVYSWSNLIFTGVIAVAFVFYRPFVNVMFKFLKDSQYGHYGEVMVNTSNGANILRIFVCIVPIIFVLLYKERAIKVYGTKVNIVINLCIYGMLFMILAYRHVFYARFFMYFDVFYLLLLPKLCNMFDKKTNMFLKCLLMGSYLAYSTLLLLSGESSIYPYKYNLNIF